MQNFAFKVFARRSLKQKPGPHDEKQDTETEKETNVSKAQQPKKPGKSEHTPTTVEAKPAGHRPSVLSHAEPNSMKAGTPPIKSNADAKRVSESQIGPGGERQASTAQTTASNPPAPIELLPSKKDLSKLKVWLAAVL